MFVWKSILCRQMFDSVSVPQLSTACTVSVYRLCTSALLLYNNTSASVLSCCLKCLSCCQTSTSSRDIWNHFNSLKTVSTIFQLSSRFGHVQVILNWDFCDCMSICLSTNQLGSYLRVNVQSIQACKFNSGTVLHCVSSLLLCRPCVPVKSSLYAGSM